MDGCNIRASAVGSVNRQALKSFGSLPRSKVLMTSATEKQALFSERS